ncbi:MAG: zinc permease [Peptococcaceae bacterium BRH_c8a]|nr:MAG: zinc permease [Peptococcaceae bacterium BRH_c8a]
MTEILLQALIAGLGTCLGAAVVVFFGRMNGRTLSLLLGFASGIMVAVVIMDLLPASLYHGGPATCLAGFIGGFLVVKIMDLTLHLIIPGGNTHRLYLRMGYLIALGIALHDLPEGIAIAAGYSASPVLGPALALAIGLHNIPEGMATAAPLRAGGMSSTRVVAVNALVSLVTPLGTLLGLFILHASPGFNALLLALAAGAMIYIVTGKLIPVSLNSHRVPAVLGMIAGFLMMLHLKLFF